MRNRLLIEAADAAQGRNATGVFPKIYVPSERRDGPVGVEYFLEHGATLKQELKEKGALLFRGCGVNSSAATVRPSSGTGQRSSAMRCAARLATDGVPRNTTRPGGCCVKRSRKR